MTVPGLTFYSQNAQQEKGKELESKREREESRRAGGVGAAAAKARSAVNSHCLSAAGKLCID